MTTRPALLERLRELEEKATPGPWEWREDKNGYCLGLYASTGALLELKDVFEGFAECGQELRVEPYKVGDMILMRTLRNLLPDIIAELERGG